MSASFDAWYASLPPLEIRYEDTFVSPQVNAHWYNYMEALRGCMDAIGKEDTYTFSPKDYLRHCADDYETAMTTSFGDEGMQMVMACRAFYNHCAVNLTLDLARARAYIREVYTLENLQPDILYRRKLYETSYAEMVYITEAVDSIARGAAPPTPPPDMSTILTAFVNDATATA